jgi:hypothetical protein
MRARVCEEYRYLQSKLFRKKAELATNVRSCQYPEAVIKIPWRCLELKGTHTLAF